MTEPVSIGEQFAFFRFHVRVYPHSECWGFRDKRGGMGYCWDDWQKLNRKAALTAVDVTEKNNG